MSYNSGYHNLSDSGIPGCINQKANSNDFKLHGKSSLHNDPISVNLDIIQSQGPGYYVIDNMNGCSCGLKEARDVQLSQPIVNFNGGNGWIGEKGCLVDTDTDLRQNKHHLTNPNMIHQLIKRSHLTTPGLVKGNYNVNVESVLQGSVRTTDKRSCNGLSGISLLGNIYTPQIPKLQEEVQKDIHIIPEVNMKSWVRGGLPTRQMIRNEDYLRRCQEKTPSAVTSK